MNNSERFNTGFNLETALKGVLPAENNTGGYATSSGQSNQYLINLKRPLKSNYPSGLLLMVKVHSANTGNSTLKVDGLSELPIKKISANGDQVDLDSNDLQKDGLYLIGFGTDHFQLMTSSSAQGSQTNIEQATEKKLGLTRFASQEELTDAKADRRVVSPKKLSVWFNDQKSSINDFGINKVATNQEVQEGKDSLKTITSFTLERKLLNLENREFDLRILANHVNDELEIFSTTNLYALINGNLVIPKHIALTIKSAKSNTLKGWYFNLPKPLNQYTFGGVLLTDMGNKINYTIDNEGRVRLYGDFVNGSDRLQLNFKPYVAKSPLEFFGQKPVNSTEQNT